MSAEAQPPATDGVDFDTAVSDPAAFYADPDAVMADPHLTNSQRRQFLEQWGRDIQRRQESLSEGMGASSMPPTGQDSEWERRIFKLLERLPEGADSSPPLSRLWRRLIS